MRNDLVSDRRAVDTQHRVPMLRRVLYGLGAALLLFLSGSWVYHTFLQSDEDRIRGLLEAAALAACERRPSGVTEILSDDFKFQGGIFQANRDDAHAAMVQLLMTRYRQVEVAIDPTPIPVRIDPAQRDRAEVEFRAKVRGRFERDGEWEEINRQAGGTLFRAVFKRTDRGWRMYELGVSAE